MSKGVAILGELSIPDYFGIKQFHFNLSGLRLSTWEKKFSKIADLIDQKLVQGVVVYLPTPLLVEITLDEYQEIWHKYLDKLKQVRLLVVVYEQNFLGNFDFYDYDQKKYLKIDEINEIIKEIEKEQIEYQRILMHGDKNAEKIISHFKYINDANISDLEFHLDKYIYAKKRIENYTERREEFQRFLSTLLSDEIELVTFKQKKEVLVRVETFISNLANDIVFSVYVNNEYFLSGEFNDLINIMTRYLNKVEGLDVTFDKQSTIKGILYHVKTKQLPFRPESLNLALNRFDEFMKLCVDDPKIAEELLERRIKNPAEAVALIYDLSKKYKRLLLDIKHQKEKVVLLLRQEFEADIMNVNIYDGANLILDNFNSLEISTLNNPYEKIFIDSYTKEEEQIIALAKEHENSDEILVIKSSLDQIKDEGLPEHQRQSAGQKIKSNLFKIGKKAMDKAEDLAIKILIEYIDQKINL